MMQESDFLRHVARPEWGIGQVLSRGEDRLDVQFRHGVVPLKFSVAAAFLERVSKAEAAAAGADTQPAREKTVKRTRPAKNLRPKPV